MQKGRTIEGEIRRIRRLLKADVDGRKAVMSCDQYGEFLQHLDNIETMASEMKAKLDKSQSAMKHVLDCPACAGFTAAKQASYCMKAVADAIHEYYS